MVLVRLFVLKFLPEHTFVFLQRYVFRMEFWTCSIKRFCHVSFKTAI